MLNISKENNSIRVEATDYSFYPFNGVVTYPSNSVIVVTDKSNMATFKSSTNGDVLFVGNINELTIDGNKVTKDTIVGEFTKIANSSASGEIKGLVINDNQVTAGLNQTIGDNVGVAVGNKVELKDNYSVVIGNKSSAGNASVAIGEESKAQGPSSVAIGYSSTAGYSGCTAIGGELTRATGTNSTAVGCSALAQADNGLALGANATADYDTPLVIVAGNHFPGLIRSYMITGDSKGKISIPLADGTTSMMCIQDEINALKAGGPGGTVDAYTKAESDAKYALKSEVEELKAQLVTLTNKLNTINGEDI